LQLVVSESLPSWPLLLLPRFRSIREAISRALLC
jgi:hypothetical protein